MSKIESIYRYFFIIRRLKKSGANSQEIINYLDKQGELLGYDFHISERTLQRDINDIRNIFSIFIVYDNRNKKYKIEELDDNNPNAKILETLEWLSLMKIHKNFYGYIQFERKEKSGIENLSALLEAIKEHKITNFWYLKGFDVMNAEPRGVYPLGLKEFKSQWYLVAKDTRDGYIKTFGLDRIYNVELTSSSFESPQDFDLHTFFEHCFGIIRPPYEKPQDIILSFSPNQSKYVRSHPLHHSQQIINDTDGSITIKLHIYITFDFVMELLSYGDAVKVISPQSLAKDIETSLHLAWIQYL